VISCKQNFAVATGITGGEAVVQHCGCFDLLGVSHSTGQTLGITSRQAVIQVIFNRLFGDRETKGNGFVLVTSGPRFLRIIVRNCVAFVLDRRSRETGQLGFFFKRTLGSLGFVDFLVLFAVTSVLHTKQRIKAGKEFLQ